MERLVRTLVYKPDEESPPTSWLEAQACYGAEKASDQNIRCQERPHVALQKV